MPIALYIHIPFCASKCAYCDFASYAGRLEALPVYLSNLEEEMAQRAKGRVLKTVFIGGGTPSLLSGGQVSSLMDGVRRHFALDADAEITIEANPGTLSAQKLAQYRRSGINRLSMGAQARQTALLRLLGRIHSWPDVEAGVHMAREAGFGNINLDLMYALPRQTVGDWEDTLRSALALNVEHISAYGLILEPDTPLRARVDAGELQEATEDTALSMQRLGTRLLGVAGLSRYEISNYARPGFECRHNITYWTRGDYLGLGAAAHSLIEGARLSNTSALHYEPMEPERITPEDAFFEAVMLGTRMTRGVRREGLDAARIERLQTMGLVQADARRVWLTERGMELQNPVVLELLG